MSLADRGSMTTVTAINTVPLTPGGPSSLSLGKGESSMKRADLKCCMAGFKAQKGRYGLV